MSWFSDFFSLIFPRVCQSCRTPLLKGEQTICTKCIATLPYTRYWEYNDNPVAQKFWGQVDIVAATSLLHFRKGTKIRKLVHLLKYKGNTDVGYKLGLLLGSNIKQNSHFSDVDIVVAVPLHPKKQKKRGYNQSDFIADGVAEALGATPMPNLIRRKQNNETQTRKNRVERYQNVRSIFEVPEPSLAAGKHILIVDDVITTGATVESCAAELLSSTSCKVSIASVGTV